MCRSDDAPRRLRLDEELQQSALRLVEQFDQLPAGSVLRCFALNVSLARRIGVPTLLLAAVAEGMSSERLRRRCA